MSLKDDLRRAIDQYATDREISEYVAHNLKNFYSIHCSRLLANQFEIPFDMRKDHWYSTIACFFVGYASDTFYQEFSPIKPVRSYLLRLAQELEKSRASGVFSVKLPSLWSNTKPGQIRQVTENLIEASLQWNMSDLEEALLPHRKDLAKAGGLVQHFRNYIKEIGIKDTVEEDLRVDLAKRVQFLPYMNASDEKTLLDQTCFFVTWYNLFTTSNAYAHGGAQSFGPHLGNNSCNDFLKLANAWFEGKLIKDTHFFAFGSSGQEKIDISQYTPMTELYGYLTMNRRPFFNKKTRNFYGTALNELELSPHELNERAAEVIRNFIKSDPQLELSLANLWRQKSLDVRHNIGERIRNIESCPKKRSQDSFEESDRITHLIKDQYQLAFDRLNLSYQNSDMAIAMANLMIDAYYYKQTQADVSLLETASDSEELDSEQSEGTNAEDADSPDKEDIRLWLIGTGGGGYRWTKFLEESKIAIGLKQYPTGSFANFKNKDDLDSFMLEHSTSGRTPPNDSLCAWQFVHDLKVGDLVIAKQGRSTIYGLGRVTGPYEHDPQLEDYSHSRRVEWIKTGRWTLPDTLSMITKTLTYVGKYPEYARNILKEICPEGLDSTQIEPKLEEESYLSYTREDALNELFIPSDQLDFILRMIKSKKNIILQGPPGVGKTYLAKKLAYTQMGEKNPDRILMVQFHQSFSYEDFIQGIRPTKEGHFRLQHRSFYNLCKAAHSDPQHDYFCIIDEINRGNLGKIFGELLMLIEQDKRTPEYEVVLTYADSNDEKFHIPSNLYIIGLMNTADRSLTPIDNALRRRFRFIDIEPAFHTVQFKRFLKDKGASEDLIEFIIDSMTQINELIAQDKRLLGPGFRIGHSYFCPNKDEKADSRWLQDVIQTEIIELLKEYWYENESSLDNALQLLKIA